MTTIAADRRRAGAGLLRGIRLPLACGAVALGLYATLLARPYDLRILTICGVFALLVIGFQFIFGHAGAVSLAQATFFGLGAYVTGILGASWGYGFLVTFPLSCLVPVLLAVIVGVPVLKLEDHYFALATLGIGLVVALIAIEWRDVTGGTNGLSGVPPITLPGLEVAGRFPTFLFVWGVLGLGVLAAWQVTRGLYGRAFHLMRDNPVAARCLGIDVAALRFAAFILSAAYGGAAGALMAHVIKVVSPENLELPVMVTCLTMTVIGGRTSIAGAVLGAMLIIYLREWFRIIENYYLIAYGTAAMAVLILAPYGIVGAVERLRERLLPSPPDSPPPPAAWTPARRDEAAAGRPLLEIEHLGKSFGGIRALDDVSFALQPGEIVGLIGPNGSGKTTLLNIVSGLYRPDSGGIALAGAAIAGTPPHRIARRGIARSFQHIALADELTVLDNIAVSRAAIERAGLLRSLAALGPDRPLAAARGVAMAAAELLGIGSLAMQPCAGLPYGARRRVEVARALAAEPRLLLLDEPAAGLNEEEQRDLAQRLRAIAGSGITILVIEHNLVFLRALAERLVCLDRGRVIAMGSPEQVQSDAAVIEAYLGRQE